MEYRRTILITGGAGFIGRHVVRRFVSRTMEGNRNRRAVRWYLDNEDWMRLVTSGDYLRHYEDMYGNR